MISLVEDTDANQDALRQVEKAAGSGPVREDEELLESTEIDWQPKLLIAKKEKAWQRRVAEDAVFQEALASQ